MTDQIVERLKSDLMPVMRRMPAYGKFILRLTKDPDVSKVQKATLMAGAGYMLSPLDLVPGIIPVLGQLDDVLAVLLATRMAMKSIPKEVVTAHLQACDLTEEIINADIEIVKKSMTLIAGTAYEKGKSGVKKAWSLLGKKIEEFSDKKQHSDYIKIGKSEESDIESKD